MSELQKTYEIISQVVCICKEEHFMERQFTASLNKQMSDGMASSKNGKDTLGNNSVNKPFLQRNPTCGKRKHVALQAYCSRLTEFIGGHLGSQTGKAGIVV